MLILILGFVINWSICRLIFIYIYDVKDIYFFLDIKVYFFNLKRSFSFLFLYACVVDKSLFFMENI